MELLLTFIFFMIMAIVGVFYFVLALIGLVLPIVFWVFVIWLVIRIIKKYT